MLIAYLACHWQLVTKNYIPCETTELSNLSQKWGVYSVIFARYLLKFLPCSYAVYLHT